MVATNFFEVKYVLEKLSCYFSTFNCVRVVYIIALIIDEDVRNCLSYEIVRVY